MSQWRSAQEKYWSDISSTYDSLYKSDWSLFEDQQLLSWLVALCANLEGRALDLGCGTGLGYQLLRDATPAIQYEGIDISADMLKALGEKFPEASTRQMSIDDLHVLPSSSFQFVMALNSALSFSGSVITALRQSFRILAPGGTLLASVLNRYSLRRLVSLRVGNVEAFSTRNSGAMGGSVPAHVLSTTALLSIAEEIGFEAASVVPQGVLSGVLEHRRAIPIERTLRLVVPGLAHCLYLSARKPER